MSTFRYYAEIDLDAFEHNIRQIRQCIGDGPMLCGVIKADGYGHGAVMLARQMAALGVDWLAVSCVDEALELRKNGISLPILILGAAEEARYGEMIENHITPTIFTYRAACRLNEVLEARGAHQPYPVHIKVDTGMSRIGFCSGKESICEIKKIAGLPLIEIQGLFTHFACADMSGREKTQQQLLKYRQMADALEAEGIHIPIKHCANSAGIMAYDEAYFDMVRAGIIIYGLYPSEAMDKKALSLCPVMSLRSHITYIKEVPEGTCVSYGGTYVTDKKSKIATVPVGYADGYPRSLSGKGRVLIRGQYAPVIGRVCMDQMMVDITGLHGIEEGDTVTLVGRDGGLCIPVEEPAEAAGSFNYEFVCSVSRRVPRVYYKNKKVVEEISYLLD